MNFDPTLEIPPAFLTKFDYSSDKNGGICFAIICNLAGVYFTGC